MKLLPALITILAAVKFIGAKTINVSVAPEQGLDVQKK